MSWEVLNISGINMLLCYKDVFVVTDEGTTSRRLLEKNLNSDNILDKVLDSEKLIDETSRFREVSRE